MFDVNSGEIAVLVSFTFVVSMLTLARVYIERVGFLSPESDNFMNSVFLVLSGMIVGGSLTIQPILSLLFVILPSLLFSWLTRAVLQWMKEYREMQKDMEVLQPMDFVSWLRQDRIVELQGKGWKPDYIRMTLDREFPSPKA